MIQINLSEEQARELLQAVGWGDLLPRHIERELFVQLENKLTPPGTEQANLAAWRAEVGYTAKAVEDWKRKHETMEGFE